MSAFWSTDGTIRTFPIDSRPNWRTATRFRSYLLLPAGRGQQMSATIPWTVALIHLAVPCLRRWTGESRTKRVEKANSVFVDLSNTCAKKRSCCMSIVSALVQQRRP
jgi:hypothetical protein